MEPDRKNGCSLFPEIPRRIDELDGIIAAGGANAQLRRDIDNAILSLHETAIDLSSRRNACSFLLRLPAELLSNILRILEDVDPPYIGFAFASLDLDDLTTKWLGNLGWLHLSHVCRALRTAILQRADMWARNIYSFHHIQDEILPRCGNHPLALMLDSSSATPAANGIPLRFVLENLGRARTLSVCETREPLKTWPIDPAILLRQPLPFLEQMSIKLLPCDNSTLTGDICDLPPVEAPILKSLTLHNYMIPFLTASLTYLCIGFSEPLYLHSPSHFLDLLQSGTQIEYLSLCNCIPLVNQHDDNNSSTKLNMPKLKFLCLSGHVERCLRLWTHFTVLPETSVVHEYQDVTASYPAPNSHLGVLSQYLGDWEACPASGLTVCEHEDVGTGPEGLPNIRNLSIHLLTPCLGARSSYWDGGLFGRGYSELRQVFFEDIDSSPPHFVEAVSSTQAITDVSTITALELDTPNAYSPPAWSALLAPFVSVETLYVENTAAANLIPALTLTEVQDSPVLPRLKYLGLSQLHIVESDGPGCTRAHLIRMLVSRARRGVALQALHVDELWVDRETAVQTLIPRIQALVPSFKYTIAEAQDVEASLEPDSDSEDSE